MRKHIFILVIPLFLTSILFLRVRPVAAFGAQIHIPEKYTDIIAGERLYFELEIKYPENPQRKDLRIEYEIRQGDDVVGQSKVLKAIDTQASFTDYLTIPESTNDGLHTLTAKISDYADFKQEVSATFKVIKRSNPFQMYFFIILGAIAFLGIIISRELERLKNYLK